MFVGSVIHGEGMLLAKVINNNVISTYDSDGQEIIVVGKGIGFQKKIGQEIDKSNVEKIFRMDDEESTRKFRDILANIPLDYFEIANDVISYAKAHLTAELNQNVYITLTDHISFAIERFKQGMIFYNALANEVKMFYAKEYMIGMYALDLIGEKTGIHLPSDEAASVAMHLVNAEYNTQLYEIWNVTNLIQKAIEIISDKLNISYMNDNMEWDRLITNLKILGRRVIWGEEKTECRKELFDYVEKQYPREYKCCVDIAEYIKKDYERVMTREEIVYLVLDIIRVEQIE